MIPDTMLSPRGQRGGITKIHPAERIEQSGGVKAASAPAVKRSTFPFKRLLALLAVHRFTPETVAPLAGTTAQVIYSWGRGTSPRPGRPAARRAGVLARVLDASLLSPADRRTFWPWLELRTRLLMFCRSHRNYVVVRRPRFEGLEWRADRWEGRCNRCRGRDLGHSSVNRLDYEGRKVPVPEHAR